MGGWMGGWVGGWMDLRSSYVTCFHTCVGARSGMYGGSGISNLTWHVCIYHLVGGGLLKEAVFSIVNRRREKLLDGEKVGRARLNILPWKFLLEWRQLL